MKSRTGLYLFISGIILIILVISVIFYSPLLHFKTISLIGTQHIKKDKLLEELFAEKSKNYFMKYLGATNMLLWNSSNISSPLIKTIDIKRNWLDKSVDISIEERERYAVWCLESGCFWIANDGYVLEKAPESEGQLINNINSNQKINIEPGDSVLPIKEASYFKNILDGANRLGISITEINYDDETMELVMTINSKINLLFSLRFEPLSTISILPSLLKDKPSIKEYIDFRTENKVYYK